MRNWATIRERYLRDSLPIRLGGLAANLIRIKSFSDHPDHRDVIESLLDESKFFIEWTAPETGIDLQVELVALQLQLACWQRSGRISGRILYKGLQLESRHRHGQRGY